MRNLKIGIWIFFIFLLQTVVLAGVRVYGAVPSLVLPYLVCVMLLEDDFREAVIVSIICSAMAGALCGREFIVMVLYFFYTSLIVHALRKKPVYVTGIVKAASRTAVLSAMLEILFILMKTRILTPEALLGSVLPTVIINTALAVIIYPLLRRTLYKEEKKKLLIGDLV